MPRWRLKSRKASSNPLPLCRSGCDVSERPAVVLPATEPPVGDPATPGFAGAAPAGCAVPSAGGGLSGFRAYFSITIPAGPRGPVMLHVGEFSAKDGTWEGEAVALEMR